MIRLKGFFEVKKVLYHFDAIEWCVFRALNEERVFSVT